MRATTERMTREQMAAELRRLATEGCDLRNSYVLETLANGGQAYPSPVSENAPEAWAALCRGITCISVWPDDPEEYGAVRYDEPGRMHPLHHPPLMFVPAALEGMECDQIGQLAEKCDRLIIVMEE